MLQMTEQCVFSSLTRRKCGRCGYTARLFYRLHSYEPVLQSCRCLYQVCLRHTLFAVCELLSLLSAVHKEKIWSLQVKVIKANQGYRFGITVCEFAGLFPNEC